MTTALKLYVAAGTAAPSTLPKTSATAWAQAKSPGAGYTTASRNPIEWTTKANYWYSWVGLTKKSDGVFYVEVGANKRDFTINPESGTGYQDFSIAAATDIVCIEYDNIAAGTPESTDYEKVPIGNGKYKVTETPHQDGPGDDPAHPVYGDHFYVFVTIGSTVYKVDPVIRNDGN